MCHILDGNYFDKIKKDFTFYNNVPYFGNQQLLKLLFYEIIKFYLK